MHTKSIVVTFPPAPYTSDRGPSALLCTNERAFVLLSYPEIALLVKFVIGQMYLRCETPQRHRGVRGMHVCVHLMYYIPNQIAIFKLFTANPCRLKGRFCVQLFSFSRVSEYLVADFGGKHERLNLINVFLTRQKYFSKSTGERRTTFCHVSVCSFLFSKNGAEREDEYTTNKQPPNHVHDRTHPLCVKFNISFTRETR